MARKRRRARSEAAASGLGALLICASVGIGTVGASPSIAVRITAGPEGVVASGDASFSFEANEPATFDCSLDGAPLAPCRSPQAYAGLADGDHMFVVRATDLRGAYSDTAERRWTVRTAPPGGPSEPAAFAHRKAMRLHGPYKLTPRLLRRTSKIDRVRPLPADQIDEEAGEEVVGCEFGACAPPLLDIPDIESLLARRTPPPLFKPWEISANSNDPNIAASKTHIVVTSYNQIRFYTKSGDPVNKDKKGKPLVFPLPTAELFRPLWDTSITPKSQVINKFLNLPAGSPCDLDDPFPSDKNTFCLNDWYDTRVVFDEYRKRFWIVGVARNPKWKQESSTPQQHASRRSKIAVAVSVSQDPRDGFYLYWWDGAIDDGACNAIGSSAADVKVCGPSNTYRPGDASDYPSIGITKDYMLQTIAVDRFDPWASDFPDNAKSAGYALINIWSADALADAQCAGTCSWSYWNFNYPGTDSIVSGIVQPALQHKHGEVNNAERSFLASTQGGDRMWVWALSHKEKPIGPPLRAAPVDVAPFAGGADAPQPPAGSVTTPNLFRYSNLGSSALKAVVRNESLFATWQDCKLWSGTTGCATSVRLVKVFEPGSMVDQFADDSNFLGAAILDRTFGLRNKFDDGPDDVVFYGNSGVEANNVSDIVAVYNRAGSTVFPQARYSLWKGNEADVRPSAVLHEGAFPCGGQAGSDGPVATCNMDTAGIAVDPWDDKGIWVAHTYTNGSGAIRLAVAKVLGSVQPDLALERLKVNAAAFATGRLSFSVRATNQGDGKARRSRLRLSLVGRKPIGLGALSLPRLGSGESQLLRAKLDLPDRVHPGRYRLRAIAAKPKGKREYSGANNRIRSSVIHVKAGR